MKRNTEKALGVRPIQAGPESLAKATERFKRQLDRLERHIAKLDRLEERTARMYRRG